MAETIEIEVGGIYAQQFEILQQQVGDRVNAVLRDTVEDEIHELTKNVERQIDAQEEAQAQQEAGAVEGGEDSPEIDVE